MSWTVGTVMTTCVVSVTPDTTYKEIVERLREHRVSAVPVIEMDGRVVGIVSEADLLLKEERPLPGIAGSPLQPHGDAARAAGRNAAALMTAEVVTVGPDGTLTEAARRMHRHGVKRLPVVDSAGRLVGIVSRGDLLQPFLRSDESIAREVREDVLRGTLSIDPESLTVAVDAGVVRLEGELENRSLCRIVERLVAAVEGVVGVDARLAWRLDDRWLPGDRQPSVLRHNGDERE